MTPNNVFLLPKYPPIARTNPMCQVPRRGAREPAEHDVADSHHLPVGGLRGYRAQHLLWQGHRGQDGMFYILSF